MIVVCWLFDVRRCSFVVFVCSLCDLVVRCLIDVLFIVRCCVAFVVVCGLWLFVTCRLSLVFSLLVVVCVLCVVCRWSLADVLGFFIVLGVRRGYSLFVVVRCSSLSFVVWRSMFSRAIARCPLFVVFFVYVWN